MRAIKTLTSTFALLLLAQVASAETISLCALPPFHQLNLEGDFQVSIRQGSSYRLQLRGPRQQLAAFRYGVAKDTLTLSTKIHGLRKGLRVEIQAPTIDSIDAKSLDGNTQIDVHDGPGPAQMNCSGWGHIELFWLNRCDVHIVGHEGINVTLAGRVRQAHFDFNEISSLDAKGLKAQQIFVRTQGHARAEVWPQKDLYAEAYGRSDVYYYHGPDSIHQHTQGDSTILPMYLAAAPCEDDADCSR
jgi:hypothetical protein